MNKPEVCVIIVNYGTADLTIAAVNSVLTQATNARAVHIHVVDNASPGDDAAILRAAHARSAWSDHVTLHLEEVNYGFGGGNNVVLQRYAKNGVLPDKVFLLNPDAALENNAIEILASFLDDTLDAGFAGAGISKPDGTAVTAAFRFPNAIAEFSQNLGLGPIASLLKRWQVPLPPSHPHGKVDWVAGAAVMARSKALQDVEFFDPAFFLYYEEVDLMRQASLKGWETWYVPTAKVIHAEGAATGVKSGEEERRRKPAYWYHSWQYYYCKNHGRVGGTIAGIGYLAGMVGQNTLALMRGRRTQTPLNGIGDFWRLAMKPILGATKEPAVGVQADPLHGKSNTNPNDISFWALVKEDFETHESDILSQGFWALFWHRFGNWRMGIRPRLLRAPLSMLYKLMYKCCQWFGGIMLPYSTPVGRRVKLEHFGGMILVANEIGDDVVIRQNTTFGIARLDDLTGRPVIKNNVDIGAGAVVIGRIKIGEGAMIGANAVVTKDVPAGSTVGGVPARVLKIRDD